jgi:hypothetical protein
MRRGQRAHECESLTTGTRIDLPTAGERPDLNAVERFTNELGLRDAALTGSSFQHSIMTGFDVDLFPNHRSGFHTSQYTSPTDFQVLRPAKCGRDRDKSRDRRRQDCRRHPESRHTARVKGWIIASALLLVGGVAPDFRLMDQNGHVVRLAAAHGHKVVLVFYRGYW